MPDLAAARAFVNAELLVDECAITRDPDRTQNDVWDETTGNYTPSTTTDVYAGACRIAPDARANLPGPESGQTIYHDRYTLRIPVDSNEVRIGDDVAITASPSDPQLVGPAYRVVSVTARTWAITRMIGLERRTRGPRA